MPSVGPGEFVGSEFGTAGHLLDADIASVGGDVCQQPGLVVFGAVASVVDVGELVEVAAPVVDSRPLEFNENNGTSPPCVPTRRPEAVPMLSQMF